MTAVDDYLAFMIGTPADHPAMPPVATLRQLDPQSLREVAEQLIDENWHPEIHRLLAFWETESLLPLRISTAAPVSSWEPSRVTLIGDAIHAMSPVLAMGANTAIRDASELTRALTDAVATDMPLVEAISGYQVRMADYAFRSWPILGKRVKRASGRPDFPPPRRIDLVFRYCFLFGRASAILASGVRAWVG